MRPFQIQKKNFKVNFIIFYSPMFGRKISSPI